MSIATRPPGHARCMAQLDELQVAAVTFENHDFTALAPVQMWRAHSLPCSMCGKDCKVVAKLSATFDSPVPGDKGWLDVAFSICAACAVDIVATANP